VRLGEDLLADPLIQRPGQHRVQQLARVRLRQAFDDQFGYPRQVRVRLPGHEDQAHRFGYQAAGYERQRLHRGLVKPLHVVHQADQRPFRGHLRQQAQGGQADQKTVRRRSRAEAERGLQRLTLRNRQALEPVQHRRADLMQPSEGEFHLRLDACGVYHPEIRRSPGHIVQQRRLADARLAPHHQCPALACADSISEPVKHATLATAPPEARR